jgi:hypothetical protein
LSESPIPAAALSPSTTKRIGDDIRPLATCVELF